MYIDFIPICVICCRHKNLVLMMYDMFCVCFFGTYCCFVMYSLLPLLHGVWWIYCWQKKFSFSLQKLMDMVHGDYNQSRISSFVIDQFVTTFKQFSFTVIY